jgi:helix-turn-helix protein
MVGSAGNEKGLDVRPALFPFNERLTLAGRHPSMSERMVTDVRTLSKSEGSDRLVLIILASHHNLRTGLINPGLQTIAHETKLSVMQVTRCCTQLERLGELSRERSRGGRGHTTIYHIHLPVESETITSGGDSFPDHTVTSEPRNYNIQAPETITELGERKEKLEREKKGETLSLSSADKPERHHPFWCPAHGFVHSIRLPNPPEGCIMEAP